MPLDDAGKARIRGLIGRLSVAASDINLNQQQNLAPEP